MFEDLFLDTSPEDLAVCHLPQSKSEVQTWLSAQKWLAQTETAEWIREQNYKGVAPPSEGVLAHFPTVAGADVVRLMGQSGRSQRRFGQTFRASMGIRLGSLQIQEPISDAELQAKAGRADLDCMIATYNTQS